MKNDAFGARLYAVLIGLSIAVLPSTATAAGILGEVFDFGERLLNRSSNERAMSRDAPQSPMEHLAGNDIVKGAAAGAVLCGTLAKTLGADTRDVMIATAGCTLGGAGVGSIAAERREAYDTESEYLEAEIASTSNAVNAKEGEIRQLELEALATEAEVTRLQNQQASSEKRAKEILAKRESIEDQIKRNQQAAASYQASIEYLEESLEASEVKSDLTAEEREEQEALKLQLTEEKNALVAQYDRLIQTNNDLRAQDERLVARSTEEK